MADHIVHHAAPIIHYIHTGYSMYTLIISNLITFAIAGVSTWFVTSRGVSGVKTDLLNAQAELSTLKAKATAVEATVV